MWISQIRPDTGRKDVRIRRVFIRPNTSLDLEQKSPHTLLQNTRNIEQKTPIRWTVIVRSEI